MQSSLIEFDYRYHLLSAKQQRIIKLKHEIEITESLNNPEDYLKNLNEIQLHHTQNAFTASSSRHKLFVGGKGCGKTFCLTYTALLAKLTYPEVNIALYAPTNDLLDLILVRDLFALGNKIGLNLEMTYNQQKKRITMPNGTFIVFRTMEKPERIVGYTVGFSFVDEIDTLPKQKAEKVIKQINDRTRQKFNAPVQTLMFASPEGFNFCYEYFEKGKSNERVSFKASVYENEANLSPTYIADQKKQYSEIECEGYIYGNYVNLKGNTVYNQFDPELNIYDDDVTPEEIIHIGQDFNIERMCSVLAYIKHEDGDINIYVFDEIVNAYDTNAAINVIHEKRNKKQVWIYPDASGSARKTSAMSMTDHKLLKMAGLRVIANNMNPQIKDRVSCVQAAFKNGEGKVRLKIHRRCKHTIECVNNQAYKDGVPDKSQGLDNVLDALGYLIIKLLPIKRHTSHTVIL